MMNRLALFALCLAAAEAVSPLVYTVPDALQVPASGLELGVPRYTSILNQIDKTVAQVKGSLNSANSTQYIILVNALRRLIATAYDKANYDEQYYDTINDAILETLSNPQKTADTIRTNIDSILSKIAAIRELINDKQNSVCKLKISYECDLIIDLAVRTNKDELLKTQAHFIQTWGTEVDKFEKDYAEEFKSTAQANDAQSYLVNGRTHLWPLAQVGSNRLKESQKVLPVHMAKARKVKAA